MPRARLVLLVQPEKLAQQELRALLDPQAQPVFKAPQELPDQRDQLALLVYRAKLDRKAQLARQGSRVQQALQDRLALREL